MHKMMTLLPLALVVLLLCPESIICRQQRSIPEMLDELQRRIRTDPYFPAFHVRPERNWNNDPNGPMRMRSKQGGAAHLWMQFNPDEAVWGNMSWWHAVSPDGLVHWTPVGVSLYNDAPYDSDGVFSGSVTLDGGVPVIGYTCVSPDKGELQCLAFPKNVSDPLLREWSKDPANPIIDHHPTGEVGGNFRDPTTAWRGDSVPPLQQDQSDTWHFATGLSLASNSNAPAIASVVLWSNPHLRPNGSQWTQDAILFQDSSELSRMFECPDFFKTGSNHTGDGYVLKVSCELLKMDYFRVGSYDKTTRTFIPSTQAARYDYGSWYASKSFYDPVSGRRILWGWIP